MEKELKLIRQMQKVELIISELLKYLSNNQIRIDLETEEAKEKMILLKKSRVIERKLRKECDKGYV